GTLTMRCFTSVTLIAPAIFGLGYADGADRQPRLNGSFDPPANTSVSENPSIGDSAADLFQRGWDYIRGPDARERQAEAVHLFRMAAEQGHAEAQAAMGAYYRQGGLVKPLDQSLIDLPKSEKWFRMAADQGHNAALVNLGSMYRYGTGVPKDPNKAFK